MPRILSGLLLPRHLNLGNRLYAVIEGRAAAEVSPYLPSTMAYWRFIKDRLRAHRNRFIDQLAVDGDGT